MKKTIFITGATKNTGLGIARRFAADGWNVAVRAATARPPRRRRRRSPPSMA